MVKVAFHLGNTNIGNVDFSNIKNGNPGVGGSEYLCVLIANELSERGNIDVILLCDKKTILPHNLKYDVCGDIPTAIEKYKNSIDLFIIDSKRFNIQWAISNPTAKFMLWVNNDMGIRYMKACAKMDNILKMIHVSREMYDLYRDLSFFNKTTYIFNAVPLSYLDKYQHLKPYNDRKKSVVYIGAIQPVKGFHILAQAWPQILRSVPEANLYVIGSGKLYSRNTSMGKYGIAEEKYENSFIKYLINDKGDLLPSVHFLGIIGTEKNDILSQCKVGVPNPSGKTETFCFSAVEMQLMGCATTSIQTPAFFDTIYKKELLYKREEDLATYVINLLKNEKDFDYNSTVKYIQENFSIENVIIKWEELLNNPNKEFLDPPSCRSNYHMKSLKEFIRKYCPYYLKNIIPSVEYLYSKRILSKILP